MNYSSFKHSILQLFIYKILDVKISFLLNFYTPNQHKFLQLLIDCYLRLSSKFEYFKIFISYLTINSNFISSLHNNATEQQRH